MFLNPGLDLGCARWCRHADQCIGSVGKEEFGEVLILAMREYLSGDKERINHSLRVLDIAEKILEKEGGTPRQSYQVRADRLTC